MNEQDKLRVLIPHWISHNQEHAEEFIEWADKAGKAKKDLQEAAKAVTEANKLLAVALEKLGGALPFNMPHSH